MTGDPYGERLSGLWRAARAPREPGAPTVVSTFAGGGGSSLGYKAAGFDVRLACEWEDYPASCYRHNFPETDVRQVDVAELSVGEVLEATGLSPGELDVLDGSPPCQGFSTAGKRKLDDPRNALFAEFVRLLRGLRPRAFVMENVSGMVKGRMLWVFKRVMQELRASGYRVSCRKMNAKWFGVPQSRERVIFVGVRDDIGIEPSHPRAQERPVTIGEALPHLAGASMRYDTKGSFNRGEVSTDGPCPAVTREGINGNRKGEFVVGVEYRTGSRRSDKWNPYNKVFDVDSEPANTIPKTAPYKEGEGLVVVSAPELRGKNREIAERLKPGQRGSDVLGNGQWRDSVRLHPGQESPTITKVGALWEDHPKVVHPTETRGLTLEEVRRLGSFPDEYEFPDAGTPKKTWNLGWAVVGNSVPPMFMRAIALHVRGLLG